MARKLGLLLLLLSVSWLALTAAHQGQRAWQEEAYEALAENRDVVFDEPSDFDAGAPSMLAWVLVGLAPSEAVVRCVSIANSHTLAPIRCVLQKP